MKIIIILVALAILALALFWKPPQPTVRSEPVYKTQEQKGGNITIAVTPKILTPASQPAFDIVFDTHSVDLSFDVANASTLTDITKKTYGSAMWEGDPPSGHHRKGTLTFSRILREGAGPVTLTFKDIAGVPSWEFYFDI